MRQKLICLITALMFFTSGFTQSIVGKIYVTASDELTVYGVDSNGNLDSTKRYTASNGTKFSVIGFDANNNVKITFWRFPFYNEATKKWEYTHRRSIKRESFYTYSTDQEFIGSWANYLQFAIPPSVLNSSCKEYFGAKKEFTWGVMTLPIKARFGNGKNKYFDFEERLNLGFVFGLKNQLKGYIPQSINYLAGFGIVNARTDSLSLKDVQYYDGKNSLALSFHIGVLYQIETFQVGLFTGFDFVPTHVGRVWMHQGKPWLGLAIGVSLFSKNSQDGESEKNTNKPPAN